MALVCAFGLLGPLPARAGAQRTHEVEPGQTVAAIARRYGVSVFDLQTENRLSEEGTLRVGQTLTVPPRGVTYVRPGQSLSQIAKAHNCSVEALQRLNRLQGVQLRAGSRLKLPGFGPDPEEERAIDRDWGPPAAPGFVKLQGRIAYAEVELVDSEGRVRLKGMRALADVMRRHEGDPPQSVHPRLAVLLSKISDHFGGREMRVVSGFREAGGFTNETSRHTQGRAADIQVLGVPRRAVFEYCRSLVRTGCGFYPRNVFVHVDVREREAQWVDWAAPGGRPRFGTFARAYRRAERKSPARPREGRRVTRPDEVPLLVEVVNRQNTVVRTADERAVSEEAPLEEVETAEGAIAGARDLTAM